MYDETSALLQWAVLGWSWGDLGSVLGGLGAVSRDYEAEIEMHYATIVEYLTKKEMYFMTDHFMTGHLTQVMRSVIWL